MNLFRAFALPIWLWLWLAAPLAVSAARAQDVDACLIAPQPPSHLMKTDIVADYQSVLRQCRGPGGTRAVATRTMTLGGRPALLLADATQLTTRLESANCWKCADVDEAALADTRMMRAVVQSAEAPGIEHRGFLENAGLTHGAGPGSYLTGDLCPSTRPLDRAFLETVATQSRPAPVALSLSGLWLTRHFADYRWLLERQAAGEIEILWTNHSYHHQFRRGVSNDRNFMLTPGVDPDYEILETERLLIANGQTPSLFFRFPGLISSEPLMQAARRHHLIALGADAWLALGRRPTPGSIVLVHPNGNEKMGLRIYERDREHGLIPQPLEPLTAAPE